jgi:hypothetical protein
MSCASRSSLPILLDASSHALLLQASEEIGKQYTSAALRLALETLLLGSRRFCTHEPSAQCRNHQTGKLHASTPRRQLRHTVVFRTWGSLLTGHFPVMRSFFPASVFGPICSLQCSPKSISNSRCSPKKMKLALFLLSIGLRLLLRCLVECW